MCFFSTVNTASQIALPYLLCRDLSIYYANAPQSAAFVTVLIQVKGKIRHKVLQLIICPFSATRRNKKVMRLRALFL